MSFRVECSKNYYGSDCTTFCKAVEGVYDCDTHGNIVCVDHNKDPSTKCLQCIPGRDPNTGCTLCLSGFIGDKCKKDPCLSGPCENGATCTPDDATGDYQCQCAEGYEGMNCSTPQIQDRYTPFLHKELAYQIKMALQPHTDPHSNPHVRIEMPYEHYLFVGGLQQAAKLLRESEGHMVYTITKHESLTPVLGEAWYLRAVNSDDKDICCVKLDTVEFYLQKRPLADDALDPKRTLDGGYLLVFTFEQGEKAYCEML